jgi:hypothetical protein
MAVLSSRRTAVRRPLRASRQWDGRALICGVLAVLMLAAGLAVILSHEGTRRSGTNGVFAQATMSVPGGLTACQGREVVPADTSAVRIGGVTTVPPIVTLRQRGRLLDSIPAVVDLRAETIEAPVRNVRHEIAGVQVCLTLRAPGVLARGPTPPQTESVTIERRFAGSSLTIDYLRPARTSWWAFAATVAERIRDGHAAGGLWIVWLCAALLLASLSLTAWIVLRTLVAGRPAPRAALVIAAVAACNAIFWSLITPAFQVPDEPAHVAYVQAIGETAAPPLHPPSLKISPEQATTMADTRFGAIGAWTYRASVWRPSERRRLVADLARALSRRQTVPAYEAEPEPPLYYALEAIPYRIAHRDSLLARLMLMRICSALLAGLTALLSFQFVRECLPARPWAWTVGGLGVAFTPMFGFVAGGVNPDALTFALSAGLFLSVACAWRRGLSPPLAVVCGTLIAAGMLTKVNFYGLMPGAVLGLTLAARRTTLGWRRRTMLLVGAVVLPAAALFAAGVAFETFAWHRSITAARPIAPESHVSLLSHVNYIWQVFLPRLPFQAPTELGEAGYVQLFETFIGAFGQLVVRFPDWVYRVAAAALTLTLLLAVRALAAEPRELRWRRGELVGYAAMTAMLMLLVGLSVDLRRNLVAAVQGRYLLPLLPLFGVLLALGARGAGDRWGRAFGVAIVAGVVAWSLFGQLVTIAWFYS